MLPLHSICIHGHFYQPPRENAWSDEIPQQPSAAPYHNWNDRIDDECYLPNTQARIIRDHVEERVNNYEKISFNFGPTLLQWMEKHAQRTYARIIEADRKSIETHGGHGNAIAQAYGHLILPLQNAKDKATQVLWGMHDFAHRFSRKPEGMWLPETAVNTETLEVLARYGIRYTILSPYQAEAIRPLYTGDWQLVDGGSGVHTSMPYQCRLPSGNTIALFFYNGDLSHQIAFGKLLDDGRKMAQTMAAAFTEASIPQLVHIATDGETYGHHHTFGEMALASCIETIERMDNVSIVNYGQFLQMYPPTHEAKIKENTSWSCTHGVERWRSDCGCNMYTGQHQRWRKPLRASLDWLRAILDDIYEREGGKLLYDVWSARNDYVYVLLDAQGHNTGAFLRQHTKKPTICTNSIFDLLEMQRYGMQMYTSCGWFFDDISRIETLQILQYAWRAIEFAQPYYPDDLKKSFLSVLKKVPGNTVEDAGELVKKAFV